MITAFNCPCGNQDTRKAKMYDGCLGYQAMICTCCGAYSDHQGSHEPDDFSRAYVQELSYENAVLQAKAELQATTRNPDDNPILQIAMKFAEFVCDDFNNASSAIEAELLELL